MNVAVIGLGLIGGSVLRALALAGHRVSGYDADPATRTEATAAAAAHVADADADAQVADTAATAAGTDGVPARWRVAATVREVVAEAELVVVAVPLPAVGRVLDELADAGYTGLITDVTSVKGPVRDLVAGHRIGGAARFVGGHPMTGRETSGFGATDPGLFTGCAWVLCLEPEPGRPGDRAPDPARTPHDVRVPGGARTLAVALTDWLELAALLTALGARVVPATAAEHDRAVAAVSHVPHLLASALVSGATDPLATALAAGSYRDGTRVAASRPELVAAMCGGNAAAVGEALDVVLDALTRARSALRGGDPIAELRDWLAPSAAARAAWPPRPGSPVDLPADPATLLRLGRAGGWVTRVAADRTTVTAVLPA